MSNSRISKIVLGLAFFYLSFYIPLYFTIYSKHWYQYNISQTTILEAHSLLIEQSMNKATDNIIHFFQHKENLDYQWKSYEKIHLTEVRNIYDYLWIAAIIAAILSLLLMIRCYRVLSTLALINIFIFSFLLLTILPAFDYFWEHIFHPLLFSNNYWRYSRGDMSSYLFPAQFFKNSIGLIGLGGIILNIVVFILMLRVSPILRKNRL